MKEELEELLIALKEMNPEELSDLTVKDIFVCSALLPWSPEVAESYRVTLHSVIYDGVCQDCGTFIGTDEEVQ